VAGTSGSQTASRPTGSRRADRPPLPQPSAAVLTRPVWATRRLAAVHRRALAGPRRPAVLVGFGQTTAGRFTACPDYWRARLLAAVASGLGRAGGGGGGAGGGGSGGGGGGGDGGGGDAAAVTAAATLIPVPTTATLVAAVCVTVGRLGGRPVGGGSFLATDTVCAAPGCRQQAACHGDRPFVARWQASPAGGDTPVAGGGRSTARATGGGAAADGAAVTTASGRLRRRNSSRPGARLAACGGDAHPAPAPHHGAVLGVGWFPAADRVCRRRQHLPPLPHGRH